MSDFKPCFFFVLIWSILFLVSFDDITRQDDLELVPKESSWSFASFDFFSAYVDDSRCVVPCAAALCLRLPTSAMGQQRVDVIRRVLPNFPLCVWGVSVSEQHRCVLHVDLGVYPAALSHE